MEKREKMWANFLQALGWHVEQKDIIKYTRTHSDEEIWNTFIARYPRYTEAANRSKIYTPKDVYGHYSEASYYNMRYSFPSNSKGRHPIGPSIISVQAITEEKQLEEEKRRKTQMERDAIHQKILQIEAKKL